MGQHFARATKGFLSGLIRRREFCPFHIVDKTRAIHKVKVKSAHNDAL
jgi:hypothetical protein